MSSTFASPLTRDLRIQRHRDASASRHPLVAGDNPCWHLVRTAQQRVASQWSGGELPLDRSVWSTWD